MPKFNDPLVLRSESTLTNGGSRILGGRARGTPSVVDISPALTSSSSNGYTVTSSTAFNGGGDPYLLFSGNLTGDLWFPGTGGGGVTSADVTLQLPAIKTVTNYRIYKYGVDDISNPRDWTLEGSLNGTDWTVVDTKTNVQGWTGGEGTFFTFTCDNPGPYLYYKFVFTRVQTGDTRIVLTEIVLTATVDINIAVLEPRMTAPTSNGYTASSSTSQHNAPWNLFTGSTSATWGPNGDGIGSTLTLQMPNATHVTQYKIYKYRADNSSAPSAWTLEGSMNGSSWTTVDSRSSVEGWTGGEGTSFTYTCSTPASWLYYRFTFTALQSGDTRIVLDGIVFTILLTADTATGDQLLSIEAAGTNTSGLQPRVGIRFIQDGESAHTVIARRNSAGVLVDTVKYTSGARFLFGTTAVSDGGSEAMVVDGTVKAGAFTNTGAEIVARGVFTGSSYTVTATDRYVYSNPSGAGAVAVTLPTAPADGFLITIVDRKRNANTDNITISPAGGGTINGSGTLVISTDAGFVTLQHEGSNVWTRVG